MSWRESLIRITNYEVETLQKRLGEIVGRRQDAQMRLTMLEAQVVAEMEHANRDASLGFGWQGFLAGMKHRRERIDLEIRDIEQEEAGARDALSDAFESLKKFEHVAEIARLAGVKEADKRETAAMDEIGLRVASR
ncbi:MAG: flagellar FliJ family protein [Caulobacteraceae bacterium]|nr:flagellar FliJ family protein [Caulobacteraceae bacterium]